jgi:hypothetical protein
MNDFMVIFLMVAGILKTSALILLILGRRRKRMDIEAEATVRGPGSPEAEG